jgi:hypothetical protein
MHTTNMGIEGEARAAVLTCLLAVWGTVYPGNMRLSCVRMSMLRDRAARRLVGSLVEVRRDARLLAISQRGSRPQERPSWW